MGSSELWDQVSQYDLPRIAFKQFVSTFVRDNGRFPRIAVDGHLWLFECGYFDENQSKSKTLLNWLRKLREMLHLNCHIVIVFDGSFKFDGKRQKRQNLGTLWDSYWLLKLNDQFNQDQRSSVDEYILKCCHLFNIQTINAPAEGEAQCAYLQMTGKVDFVLSNDADVFCFGATKVLKNYSKHGWEDLPNSALSPSKSKQNERFVTYVDIEQVMGWSRNQFILFNLLVGSDYNEGVKNLGGKRAAIVANWKDPDFSEIFSTALEGAHYNDKQQAQIKWDNFGQKILKFIQSRSKSMFGMRLKSMEQLDQLERWPEVTLPLFYWDAVVRKQNLTKQSIHNHSNGDTLYEFLRCEGVPRLVSDFDRWFHEFIHHSNIVSFLWEHDDPFNGTYRLTEQREASLCDGMHKFREVCIRYKTFVPFSQVPASPEKSVSLSPTKPSRKSPAKSTVLRSKFPYYVWVPAGVVPKSLLAHLEKELAEEEKFKRSLQSSSLKRSPRKPRARSLSPQKTTLDSLIAKRPQTSTGPAKNLIASLLQEELRFQEQDATPEPHLLQKPLLTQQHFIDGVPFVNLVDTDSDTDGL